MRVGLVLGAADDVVREARWAEAAGFDYAAAGEHVFFHEPVPNPFVTLAAAAGATSRIRLLTSIALLPLYAPALAAKLAATLDQVSGGRLELGVGAGGEFPREFEACGVPVEARHRKLDECLQVFELLAGGERVSFDGEFGRIDDVALAPPAVQLPRPPVWVGGRGARSRRRAARFGDVWLPYMVTPESLRDGLAEIRTEEAGIRGAVLLWTCVDRDPVRARATAVQAVSGVYRQDFERIADRYLVFGTPEQVTARLREFAQAGAFATVVAVAAPPAERAGVLDLFVESVLPEVHD